MKKTILTACILVFFLSLGSAQDWLNYRTVGRVPGQDEQKMVNTEESNIVLTLGIDEENFTYIGVNEHTIKVSSLQRRNLIWGFEKSKELEKRVLDNQLDVKWRDPNPVVVESENGWTIRIQFQTLAYFDFKVVLYFVYDDQELERVSLRQGSRKSMLTLIRESSTETFDDIIRQLAILDEEVSRSSGTAL